MAESNFHNFIDMTISFKTIDNNTIEISVQHCGSLIWTTHYTNKIDLKNFANFITNYLENNL